MGTTRWTAFGPLTDARDLLGKLGRDLVRMKAAPDDIDPAFDFYVTALHMLDWHWPDDQASRTAAFAANPDLAIAAHVGNQAKHYTVDRHSAVDDLTRSHGGFDPSAFQRSAFQVGSINFHLPDGSVVDAIDLGERLVAWWTNELT